MYKRIGLLAPNDGSSLKFSKSENRISHIIKWDIRDLSLNEGPQDPKGVRNQGESINFRNNLIDFGIKWRGTGGSDEIFSDPLPLKMFTRILGIIAIKPPEFAKMVGNIK